MQSRYRMHEGPSIGFAIVAAMYCATLIVRRGGRTVLSGWYEVLFPNFTFPDGLPEVYVKEENPKM